LISTWISTVSNVWILHVEAISIRAALSGWLSDIRQMLCHDSDMTFLSSPIKAADGFQKKHKLLAIVVAVLKKSSDDQANFFALSLAWYGFVAIYPLLLIFVAALQLVGEKALGLHIVDILHRFPVIGREFGSGTNNHHLSSSILGLLVGILGLSYGALGATRVLQKSLYHVWNIPKLEKRSVVFRYWHNFIALFILAAVFLLNAAATSFAAANGNQIWLDTVSVIVICTINILTYYLIFTIQGPNRRSAVTTWPGAFVAGILFTLITTLGAGLIEHELSHSSETYGAFAQVIGVVTFLLIISKITIYACELNCVIGRKLFPRSLDKTLLTASDKAVYEFLAKEQLKYKDQKITVTYDKDPLSK